MADSSFRINKGLTLNPQSTAPINPSNGDMYFSSTSGTYCLYQDGVWINLNSSVDVATATNLTSAVLDAVKAENAMIRLTGSTATNLHGIQASANTKTCTIHNASSATVIIKNESLTETTADNRINSSNGADIILTPDKMLTLSYDSSQDRWLAMTQPVSIDTNLPMIGSSIGDTLDGALYDIDAEIAKLFEDRNILLTQGGLITFTGNQVEFTENLNLVINQKISGAAPQIISLGSATQSFTNSGDMLIATIDRTAGTATLSTIASGGSLPSVNSSNQEVFLIAVRYDALDGTQRLYWRTGMAMNAGQTIRLGSSGTGNGSGLGDDLITSQYQASFTDEFDESAVAATSAVDSSKTNATYNASKAIYQISYDASKTATTLGTVVTMSSAPSFTVAVGDVLISGIAARRITGVVSQTSYTIESAFSADLSSAPVTVSQVVHTKDIYNTTFDGSAISSAFTDNFSQILVDYEDTSTAGDAVFDINTAPVVGFSASSNGSTWSSVNIRPTNPLTELSTINLPSSGSALYVRFFANKSSGSGTVNILKYKAYMQKSSVDSDGGAVNSAYAMTDGTGTPVNCSIGLFGGKTIVMLDWQYPLGISSGESHGSIDVYLNGQLIPRFIDSILTPDASYTELTSNVIQLDSDYSGVSVSVEVLQRTVVVDQSSENSSYISALKDLNKVGHQPFVDNVSNMLTATSSSTLGTGKFWSTITNRAPIPDITNDLKVSMGTDRVYIPSAYILKDEHGPDGQPVYAATNDDKNLIRFVGSFPDANNYASGSGVASVNIPASNNFIEITFYGTDLNLILNTLRTSNPTFTYSINGGSETAVTFPSSSIIDILSGQNYNPNIVVNIVRGLSLGLYTIRIKRTDASSDQIRICGLEVLNSTIYSNLPLKVNKGISYANGNKLMLESNYATNYDSDFESGSYLASKGGRVLVYQKPDGSIAKSITATDTLQANLTSADHSNEDIARVYYWRQFGASRGSNVVSNFTGDDFSTLAGGAAASRTFTLDDGVTTLFAAQVNVLSVSYAAEAIKTTANTTSYITFTFVGTGLDIIRADSASGGADTYTVFVDGQTTGTLSSTGNTAARKEKIVSGLPYGTHVVKIEQTSAVTFNLGIIEFVVYQPKKPSLPEGCVELADYNIMASFTANTSGSLASSTAPLTTISTGTLRKYSHREILYGSSSSLLAWTLSDNNSDIGRKAVNDNLNNAGDYFQYTFYGTGLDFRFRKPDALPQTWGVQIDGQPLNTYITANGGTVGFYGAGVTSFNSAGNSNLVLASVTGNAQGAYIKDLPLGIHTVKFSWVAGTGAISINCMDIITPIHSYAFGNPSVRQNGIEIGSIGISDNRVFTPIKEAQIKNKNISEAFGIAISPTTTSTTFVPCPDMSIIHYSNTNRIKISWMCQAYHATANQAAIFIVYVNGTQVGLDTYNITYTGGTGGVMASNVLTANVPSGFNKVDLYWASSNSTVVTATSDNRNMLVEDID